MAKHGNYIMYVIYQVSNMKYQPITEGDKSYNVKWSPQ